MEFTDRVVDELVSSGQLEEENREKVREALLQKHRHQCTKKDSDKKIFPHIRSWGDIVGGSSSQSKKVEERSNSIQSHNSIMNWLGRQNGGSDASFSRKDSKKDKDLNSSKVTSDHAIENGEDTHGKVRDLFLYEVIEFVAV